MYAGILAAAVVAAALLYAGEAAAQTEPLIVRHHSVNAFPPLCTSTLAPHAATVAEDEDGGLAFTFGSPVQADGAYVIANMTEDDEARIRSVEGEYSRDGNGRITSVTVNSAQISALSKGNALGVMLLERIDTVATRGLYSTHASGSPLYVDGTTDIGTVRTLLPDVSEGAANNPAFTDMSGKHVLGTDDDIVRLAGEVLCASGWAVHGASNRTLYKADPFVMGSMLSGEVEFGGTVTCDAELAAGAGTNFGDTTEGGISDNVVEHTITNMGNNVVTELELDVSPWNEGESTEVIGGATEWYNGATAEFEPVGLDTFVFSDSSGFDDAHTIQYRVNLDGITVPADVTATQTFTYSYTCPPVTDVSAP